MSNKVYKTEELCDSRSPKHSHPNVTISMCSDRNYWLVNIECKDRNKLLFDTVCTLADLDYDVFHATIDSVNGRAVQEYYIRSRLGCTGEPSRPSSRLGLGRREVLGPRAQNLTSKPSSVSLPKGTPAMVRKAIVSGTSKSPSAFKTGYLVSGNGSWPTFRTER